MSVGCFRHPAYPFGLTKEPSYPVASGIPDSPSWSLFLFSSLQSYSFSGLSLILLYYPVYLTSVLGNGFEYVSPVLLMTFVPLLGYVT